MLKLHGITRSGAFPPPWLLHDDPRPEARLQRCLDRAARRQTQAA